MKPLAILSHMPPHIRQKITNETDYHGQLSLRQCSSDFRTHVDGADTSYKLLKIHLLYDAIDITLFIDDDNYLEARFRLIDDGYIVTNDQEDHLKIVESGDYFDAAAERIRKILQNPRLTLEKLDIDLLHWGADPSIEINPHQMYDNVNKLLGRMEQILEKRDNPLPVSTLHVKYHQDAFPILPIIAKLDAQVLKSIYFGHDVVNAKSYLKLSDFAHTRQWREAEQFMAHKCQINLPYREWRHFTHFQSCSVYLDLDFITPIVVDFLSERRLRTVTVYFEGTQQEKEIVRFLGYKIGAPVFTLELMGLCWEKLYPEFNEVVRVRFAFKPNYPPFFIQRTTLS